jgi:DNA polymerase IV
MLVKSARTILHGDMDAFYASVEARDNPELRGRPIVVGGGVPRGVVAAASYEARRYGVFSAMPTAKALKLCPDLIVLRPRMGDYQKVSHAVFSIFRSYTPLVEPLSLDEAFLDVSGSEKLHGSGVEIAKEIRCRVREEVGLAVSVGVAPSKFIAKIASDLCKPDGLRTVTESEVLNFLHPLPVTRLFGVGKTTAETLKQMGIETIGQLASYPKETLIRRLGSVGQRFCELANGIDERPVISEHAPDSIGHEDTFAGDIDDPEELGRRIIEQADRVAVRLRQQNYRATVVVLKVKDATFKSRTRRRKLRVPTQDGQEMGEIGKALLPQALKGLGPIRLTGITAGGLVEMDAPTQLSFDQPARNQAEDLAGALDMINEKFGRKTLIRAAQLDEGKPK